LLITSGIVLTKSIKENNELKKNLVMLSEQNENQISLLNEKQDEIGSLKDKEDENDNKINSFMEMFKDITNTYIASRADSTLSGRSDSRSEKSFVADITDLKDLLIELKELNSEEIQFDFTETENKLKEYLDHIPTLWPITGRLSSNFGDRQHPVWFTRRPHEGIDIASGYGYDIAAAAKGTVTFCGYNSSYGYHIIIDHGNGLTTLYAHASKLLVKAGLEVNKGDIIARTGSTGISTGPHLHFEIRINDIAVDPLIYLDQI
jgi:murein DD-endopeptidase MepM/ murein hydrolase activator NlpD